MGITLYIFPSNALFSAVRSLLAEDRRREGEAIRALWRGERSLPLTRDSDGGLDVGSPADELDSSVRRYIAFALQDSSDTLSQVVSELIDELSELLAGPSVDSLDLTPVSAHWLNPLALGESIKTSAARKSYGYRSPQETKSSSVFEDSSLIALWRWEVCI